MTEAEFLNWLYDVVRSYGDQLGDESKRKFFFRREARKRRPRIDPQTIDDFIDAHDFS